MRYEIVTLTDPATGSLARFLIDVGCNCFQFLVPTTSGPLDVLWSEPGFEQGDRRASGSGIPLLFPFPGRLHGTTLHWEGRDWPLEAGDGLGNAIHGFVHERRWRVVEQETSRFVAEFHASQDDPRLLACWPADFRITASYELQAARLTASYRIENPGPSALPCGFGTHPYFRLPLGGTSAQDCRVQLPVQSQWELAAMIPTGREVTLDNAAHLQQGQRFGDMHYDDVFAKLVLRDGRSTAAVEDMESRRRTVMTFDSDFQACVVYTPPHREAICIEPYTCVPDSIRLEARGIAAGLRVLSEGASWQLGVEIELLDASRER